MLVLRFDVLRMKISFPVFYCVVFIFWGYNFAYGNATDAQQASKVPQNGRQNSVAERLFAEIDIIQKMYREKMPIYQENSPFEAMMAVCSFGCDAQIRNSQTNQTINIIAALCHNQPIGSMAMLKCAPAPANKAEKYVFYSTELLRKRVLMNQQYELYSQVGYFSQERQGDFLSILAQSCVPITYKFTVENQPFRVADLVEFEKRQCYSDDLSSLLVGLSYYASWQKWIDDYGNPQDVLAIIRHELARTVPSNSSKLTDKLFGLTFAYYRRYTYNVKPVEPLYDEVNKYIVHYLGLFLQNQNTDGTWNETYLQTRGKSRDRVVEFIATSNITRWLVSTLSSEQLETPQIVASIQYLSQYLKENSVKYNSGNCSQDETRAYAYALQTLEVYRRKLTPSVRTK